MSYNPEIHKRKSIRLKGYDYSQEGLYFITLCCQNRECLFGQIHNGSMILNDAGKMIENEWLNLENRFPNIELHEFIVMPNHFHGILKIVGAALVAAQSTQSALVAAQSTQSTLVAAQSTQSTLVAAPICPKEKKHHKNHSADK
jgi:REP element-mobilizing transposase RayT